MKKAHTYNSVENDAQCSPTNKKVVPSFRFEIPTLLPI